MIRNRLPLHLFAFTCTIVFATISATFADDAPSRPGSKDALPGVNGDYKIVKPAVPEPDGQLDNTSAGRFKIGNMDVRIGGSLTVDIGGGSIASPRR